MVLINRVLPRNKKQKGVYIDGRLKELLDGFKLAVTKHNTSVVMMVDGRSGMGKTTLANQIGLILDPNYNLNQIYYNPEDFLDGLASAKPFSFHLFDEAMLISSRSALSQINRMIIQAMSMIRSKRIYICFCVNSMFDIDRNLAISRADFLLHVYGETLIDRGRFASFFRGKDGFDRLKMLYLLGKKYYDYRQPKSNFIGTFGKEFIVDEIQYEKQKQIGINQFLRGIEKNQTKSTVQRNNLITYILKEKLIDFPKLEHITDLSQSQLYKIAHDNPKKPHNVPISRS